MRGHSEPADDVKPWDDEIASLLHQLYDLRGKALERLDASTVSRVDSLLDGSWTAETQQQFETLRRAATTLLSTVTN